MIIQLNQGEKVPINWSILGMSQRHIFSILTFIEYLLYARPCLKKLMDKGRNKHLFLH